MWMKVERGQGPMERRKDTGELWIKMGQKKGRGAWSSIWGRNEGHWWGSGRRGNA